MVVTVLVLLLLLVSAPFALRWLVFQYTHSVTEDAFVESYIVNLGPQVSGHIDQVRADEHDTVRAGELLIRIDPRPYQRQVELAEAKHSVAIAQMHMEEAVLARLKAEVPRRIEISEKELAVAAADHEKSKRSRELTEQDVNKAITEAEAGLASALAVKVNAEENFRRYKKLYAEMSVPEQKFEDATKVWKTAVADHNAAEAKLARARANLLQVDIADQSLRASQQQVHRATEAVELAKVGDLQIKEAERQVQVKQTQVTEAERALEVARLNLAYTEIKAPFDGVVVKTYRHLGDFVPVGSPVLSVYSTDLLFVTANLEETRLQGVSPGNAVRLDVDAFPEPFTGRVLWIGKATGANFALVPRDVSAGEFTKVVQRLPTRILINKDDRWSKLRPGLSVTVAIDHGPGDLEWAKKAAAEELRLEQGVRPKEAP